MSVGPIVSAVSKIPWGKILASAPIIVELGGKIFDKIGHPGGSNKEEQAKLFSKLVGQIENHTTALQIISKRVNYFLILSALAFITGVVSLVLVLIK
jgi:hypothetical protein